MYGEHTDYGGMTYVWRNQFNGLQAKVDGEWHDIPMHDEDEDALVINLADLMQFWTNHTWHSPLHRVVNRSQARDLVSIVFFSGKFANKGKQIFVDIISRTTP